MLSKSLLYYSEFEFFYKCMCLLQFLITCEGHYIKLLKLFQELSALWKQMQHIFFGPYSKYVSSNKGLSLLKAISACYTTLLSNYIGHIFKDVPPLVFVINRQRERNWRGGRAGETSALILERKCPTIFIYGLNFWFKIIFEVYLGKKISKFFPAGPFFRVLQIKCLSKCSYFKKTPLPWKIPGYAPGQMRGIGEGYRFLWPTPLHLIYAMRYFVIADALCYICSTL